MWSLEDIQSLVLEVAGSELKEDALSELIYLLKVAQKEAPSQIAEVAIQTPVFWDFANPFTPRLAFGVVHHSFFFLDPKTRETLIKLYTRQVNRVRLHLEHHESEFGSRLDGPKRSLGKYDEYLQSFCFTTTGFIGLSEEEVTKAEIGAVLENIILATEYYDDLVQRLLKRVTRHLHNAAVKRLAVRMQRGIDEGLTNSPINDDAPQLTINVDAVQFTRHNHQRPSFAASAKTLQKIASQY